MTRNDIAEDIRHRIRYAKQLLRALLTQNCDEGETDVIIEIWNDLEAVERKIWDTHFED